MTNITSSNYKYPICPQCGHNSIVGFTPPKKGKYGKENIDWEMAHLYCSNDANCTFNTRFLDLTTPRTEPDNSYALSRETSRELINILSNYCGERGDNESAPETLVRIIHERDILIKKEIEKLLK
jgi:hypothetical protein